MLKCKEYICKGNFILYKIRLACINLSIVRGFFLLYIALYRTLAIEDLNVIPFHLYILKLFIIYTAYTIPV